MSHETIDALANNLKTLSTNISSLSPIEKDELDRYGVAIFDMLRKTKSMNELVHKAKFDASCCVSW